MLPSMPPGTLAEPLRLTLHRPKDLSTASLALVHTTAYPTLHARCGQFLHPQEAAAYAQLVAPRRQQSFLLGRYAAKQALSSLLHESVWTRLQIVPGVFTQPVVHYPTPAPVEVSITHAGDLAGAVAFPAGHPMGLDVEPLNATSLEAMRSQLLEPEWHAAGQLSSTALLRATILWTAKEALAKVLKCGMMTPWSLLETVALQAEPGGYGGHFRHFGQYKFHTWVLQEHVLSLVLPKWTTLEGELGAWALPLLATPPPDPATG